MQEESWMCIISEGRNIYDLIIVIVLSFWSGVFVRSLLFYFHLGQIIE